MLLLMAPGQPCASSSPDFDTHLRSVDSKASGGAVGFGREGLAGFTWPGEEAASRGAGSM